MKVAIYFHPKTSNLELLFSLGWLTKPANTWVIPAAVSETGSHGAPQPAGPSVRAGCACGELVSWSGWKASRGLETFVSAELKESPLRSLLHSHSLIPACLGSSLTCYNGLPVPLPVGSDPDKFLPQERCDICVAVHKNSDGIFQGNGCQIFHLHKQVIKKKVHMISGKRPDKLPFNFLPQYVSQQLVLPLQSLWQRKALSDGGGNTTW